MGLSREVAHQRYSRPRVRPRGLKDQWRARAGVLCLWACGLHRVGENAKLLAQSIRVYVPRQARMRMGACRRWIALSVGRRERRVEGRHSVNKRQSSETGCGAG